MRLNLRVHEESHSMLGVLRGRQSMSGVSKEKVTLWAGCTGLKVLAGFLGQSHKPSGEPTTTEAKRVVIVDYIWASPACDTATSALVLILPRTLRHDLYVIVVA